MIFTAGCKKDPGLGGKAHIEGHVEHHESPVTDAVVSIWYGADSKPESQADDQRSVNDEGEFEFENLTKGDYYLYAYGTVTDSTGVENLEGGVSVTIDKKSGDFEADIHLE